MLSSYDPDAEPEEEEVTNDINRDDIFAKKKSDQELRL